MRCLTTLFCQQIDNDLSIRQNVPSNKMIHAILALVFLTMLFLSSRFFAPEYIASYYGHQALMTLKKLERHSRTMDKRRADVIF